jgi:hypothetical protein
MSDRVGPPNNATSPLTTTMPAPSPMTYSTSPASGPLNYQVNYTGTNSNGWQPPMPPGYRNGGDVNGVQQHSPPSTHLFPQRPRSDISSMPALSYIATPEFPSQNPSHHASRPNSQQYVGSQRSSLSSISLGAPRTPPGNTDTSTQVLQANQNPEHVTAPAFAAPAPDVMVQLYYHGATAQSFVNEIASRAAELQRIWRETTARSGRETEMNQAQAAQILRRYARGMTPSEQVRGYDEIPAHALSAIFQPPTEAYHHAMLAEAVRVGAWWRA